MKRLGSNPSREAQFELCLLTTLPCGCVISDFRSETLDVEFVSIEAKGPHCTLGDHATGAVLGLGETRELGTLELDDPSATEPAA